MMRQDERVIVSLPYDHQIEIANEFDKRYVDEGIRSISYHMAPSCGKSYNWMDIIERYFAGKRIMYVTPKNSIHQCISAKPEFKELAKQTEIRFCCNAAFNKIRPWMYDYDAIFVDECHHLTSDIQGPNIVELGKWYEEHGKLFCGFTATPEYYKDNGKEDPRSFFKCNIEGIDIETAIKTGLFPEPIYYIASTDIEKRKEILGKDAKKYHFEATVRSTETLLRNTFETHSDIDHWLVFFSRHFDLLRGAAEFAELFSDFKVIVIPKGCKDIESYVKEFDASPGKTVLFSVNTITEGVHPDRAEGLILYRSTDNPVVFEQILGRILHMNAPRRPVFVDVMNSGARVRKTKDRGHSNYREYDRVTNNVDEETYQRLRELMEVRIVDYGESSRLQETIRRRDIIGSHRGIRYHGLVNLADQLNMSYKDMRKYITENGFDSIDALIDDWIEHNTKVIDGISFINDKELAKKLHVSMSFITVNKKAGLDYSEIIKKAKSL